MKKSIEQIKQLIYQTESSNKNALYDSHIYWSQKPYNICDILIENLTEPGDVVYDPFLGSGVTILEAVKNQYGRIGIGCEINEAPAFIVQTLLRQYDEKKYESIAKSVIQKLDALYTYYETTCIKCGQKATVTSVIFDKPTRSAPITVKSVNYVCKNCKKGTKEPDGRDYELINVNEKTNYILDVELIENTKLAVYANEKIEQIFTGRNYVVLDRILAVINGLSEYKDVFKYILMSVLHLCKITDTHSNSQWPLWIPKVDCVEKNVIDLFKKKIVNFEKTIKYLSQNYTKAANYKLLLKGSQYVTEADIPNNSVQLIITDPPYLGQVAYSEYMQLYKPFLGLGINLDDEIVVSSAPSRKKDEQQYFSLLEKVFANCATKLKTDGYMCLYFHDSSLSVWDQLIDILKRCRFRYVSQVHIKKSNTLKNIISPKKSLNGDSLLFFIKDPHISAQQTEHDVLDNIEMDMIRQAKSLVRQYGSISTPELYDNGLMEVLIQNEWLKPLAQKYDSLVQLFDKHLLWDQERGKWVNTL